MFMDKITPKGVAFIQTLVKVNGVWRILYTHKYENLITDKAIELLRDSIETGLIDPIKYIGIGTGQTTVAPSDTEIEDEIFRTYTDYTATVGTKKYFYFYISPEEANTTWHNIGLITLNGILFTHLNCNEIKNNSMAKNISYYIEF